MSTPLQKSILAAAGPGLLSDSFSGLGNEEAGP